MASYTVDTKWNPEKVLAEGVAFFGPQNLGLEIKEQGAGCATFEGGGGFVHLGSCQEKGKTRVNLETREWDYQVKAFMRKLV